jgi:hypothetical protein
MLQRATGLVKQGVNAMKGRATSANVSRAATGTSSAVRGFAKNSKTAQRIVKNPGKSAAIGLGAVSVGGYGLSGRRGRGVDKFAGGRPTGMYGR